MAETRVVDPQEGGLDRVTDDLTDAELLAAERRQALRDALAELPEGRRELLLMLLTDPPLAYEEISRRLGIPIGSIGPTRARAFAQLREHRALRHLGPEPTGDRADRDDTTRPTDDELLAELREAVAEADLVTDRRREAARAAFTWRTVDAELAELLHDSALEAGAAVRGADDPARTLSFASGELTLEVEVDGDAVTGQVLPAQDATRDAAAPDADDRTVEVDGAGFFRIEDVGSGPVRFVVTTAEHDADQPLGRRSSLTTNGGPTAEMLPAVGPPSSPRPRAARPAPPGRSTPCSLMYAAMAPVTIGVANDVPLHWARPVKFRTSPR